VQKSITLIAAVFLLLAAYTSIRISYAEFLFRQNTLESVQRAVELDPSDARYFGWLAALLENNGQNATSALDTAIRLNPLDSRLWIRRALNAESAGNPAEAERILLHAASIDRLMEPRWTLMNFYFRSGDATRFWSWAKAAFVISYGDRTPLFDLCWRLRPDPASIAQVLPSSYPLQFQYFQFLLDKGSLVDAAALAERILPASSPADTSIYTRCADRLLQSGDSARALHLWNVLCDRHLLPFRAGETLTNPAFEHPPTGVGFDWRLPTIPGVTALRVPPALRFTFTGQQPATCVLLAQTIPIEPFRVYCFRFQYRTFGLAPGSGLRLRALDQITRDLSAEIWTPQTLTFTSPASLGHIALEYNRPSGFPRIEGTLEIRNLTLNRP
jgi:hypothetical protein